MTICKHGTDLEEYDCINCENENDEKLQYKQRLRAEFAKEVIEKLKRYVYEHEGADTISYDIVKQTIKDIVEN